MKKVMTWLFSCLWLMSGAAASQASATTLNFEGINTATDGSNIPTNYGGFTWVNGQIFREGVLGTLVATSGEWHGGVSSITDQRVRSATPFSFVGAYFEANRPGTTLQLLGYKVTVDYGLDVRELLYSATIAPGDTPEFVELNFEGINELYLHAISDGQPGGGLVGFDDFVFEGSPSELPFTPRSVSEPASIGLFLMGLIGAWAWRRRRFVSPLRVVTRRDVRPMSGNTHKRDSQHN